MNETIKFTKVTIKYKNDKEATNKLINLIIDFLIENNNAAGEDIDSEIVGKQTDE